MRCFVVLLALWGCGEAPCVDLPNQCDPLYDPTFDLVHERTLLGSCALGGCHSGEQPAATMNLEDADGAYDQLLDGRVDAGDAECSLLMRRVAAEHDANLMPPGSRLGAEEQCAIQQWIEAGAQR